MRNYNDKKEKIIDFLAAKSCSWWMAYPPNAYYQGIISKEKLFKNINVWSNNPLTQDYGLFIYIPYCKYKCNFCIYYKEKTNQKQYLQELFKDIFKLATILKNKSLNLDNIYIGGGTPTFLSYSDLESLFLFLGKCFDLSKLKQFSIEATPDSLDEKKIKLLGNHGINRVGFGLQSVDDFILQKIGRLHTISDLTKKIFKLRKIGIEAIHIDLIVGLPEENILSKNYIKNIVDYLKIIKPEHISLYSYKQAGKRMDNINKTMFSENIINKIMNKIYGVLIREGFFVGSNYKGKSIFLNKKMPNIIGYNRNSEGKYFDLSVIGLGITSISSLYLKKHFMNLKHTHGYDGKKYKETILNKDEMIRRQIISDIYKNRGYLNIDYYFKSFKINLIGFMDEKCNNAIKNGIFGVNNTYVFLKIEDHDNDLFDIIFNYLYSSNIREYIYNQVG